MRGHRGHDRMVVDLQLLMQLGWNIAKHHKSINQSKPRNNDMKHSYLEPDLGNVDKHVNNEGPSWSWSYGSGFTTTNAISTYHH
jgi:hypothetical protein